MPRKYKRRPKCHAWCKRGRHVFTREESQLGFERAIESIISRHPNAVGQDGRHMACKFLQGKNPLWFEARKIRKQVQVLESRHTIDRAKLRSIKRSLSKLEAQARCKGQTKPKKGSKP